MVPNLVGMHAGFQYTTVMYMLDGTSCRQQCREYFDAQVCLVTHVCVCGMHQDAQRSVLPTSSLIETGKCKQL